MLIVYIQSSSTLLYRYEEPNAWRISRQKIRK